MVVIVLLVIDLGLGRTPGCIRGADTDAGDLVSAEFPLPAAAAAAGASTPASAVASVASFKVLGPVQALTEPGFDAAAAADRFNCCNCGFVVIGVTAGWR